MVGADDDTEGGNGGTLADGGEGPTSAGGTGGTDSGSAGEPGSGGTGGAPTACGPLAPRLIRLSFDQLVRSIEALAGEEIATELRQEFAQPAERPPAFPPLADPSDGSVVGDSQFLISDALAERAATRMAENLEGFTGCSSADDFACVRDFLTEFAGRAYRRPLADPDVANIMTVADEAEATGTDAAGVLRTGVYAVLSTPSFLYRTEFGATSDMDGELRLTPHEVASALAFFVLNAPPDAELLAAADADDLKTPADIAREVDRLLQTPHARANLGRAFGGYLGSELIQGAVIIDESATSELRTSAVHELRWFLDDHLFSRPLGELLTSRHTRIDAALAPLYGVTFPPEGATADADGFAPVTLPETRAGFLTQTGFLMAMNGTPDVVNAFYRGAGINARVTCGTIPPASQSEEELGAMKSAAAEALAGSSVRDQVEYRVTQPECASCHGVFESYGVALEAFDLLGRVREVDEAGAPIRDEATLPAEGNGAVVSGAAEMAEAIAQSGAFTACVTRAFLEYSLAEVRPERTAACDLERAVAQVTETGDASFSKIVEAIAQNSVLAPRSTAATRRLP